jgi:hypothetical protein
MGTGTGEAMGERARVAATVVEVPRVAQEGPTVLASWTATVVRALSARGVDGEALAREAGIDPAVFEIDGARIPLATTTRLWHLAVEATGDACIGLDVARHARPGTFHGLSVGVVSSQRFREALERVVRFAAVVCSPSGRAGLAEVDGRLVYETRWPPGAAVPSHESMEAILACVVRAGRFLMGRDLSPVSVELLRPERPDRSRFETFFGCEVTYGADRYALAFPRDVTDAVAARPGATRSPAPPTTSSAPTSSASTPGSRDHRARCATPWPRSSRDGEVTSAAVAARLALSARTMQRRLHDEGTTFRDVVADVRDGAGEAGHRHRRRARAPARRPARVLPTPRRSDAPSSGVTGMTPSEYAEVSVGGHDT